MQRFQSGGTHDRDERVLAGSPGAACAEMAALSGHGSMSCAWVLLTSRGLRHSTCNAHAAAWTRQRERESAVRAGTCRFQALLLLPWMTLRAGWAAGHSRYVTLHSTHIDAEVYDRPMCLLRTTGMCVPAGAV